MKRKNPIAYITDDDYDKNVYCTYCEKVGIKSILKERYFDTLEKPSDADEWLYCPSCNRTIPIYETKQELEYGLIFDTTDNPFDSGSEFASVGKRKKKKPVKQKDPDIAVEQGNVNILFDSQGNY